MQYPAYFDDIPVFTVYDPLAGFLGATVGGVIEYRYLDAVKLTGHSCPTVASAYWITVKAMKALYKDEMPCRGGIRVDFADNRNSGVTGVTANVVQLLTGAAGDDGFKGLSGIFFRNTLMTFGASGRYQIRFAQREAHKHVDASVDLSRLPQSLELRQLMQRCLSGAADFSENQRFRELWQLRVRQVILDHGEDPEVFRVVLGR
jgi:formylmethanofuran dehydrogenase subunit E